MNPVLLFIVQFVWFLVAWSAIGLILVNPRLQGYDRDQALSVWIAPQLFRVLGVGLLVPNLSPQMPRSFAVATAGGDSITAVLALVSLVVLHRQWAHARSMVWACNIFGSCDVGIALIHAARIEAARFLGAQWYVAAVMVPLMIISHVMVFRTLLRNGSRSPGPPLN